MKSHRLLAFLLISSLVFYVIASAMYDIFLIRLSRVILLPSIILWYLNREKLISWSFVSFLIFSLIGHCFLLALNLGLTDIFGWTVLFYSIGTISLLLSIVPYLDFSKLKSVANIFVMILVVFSVYLMYSTILSMSSRLLAIDIFFLVVYGISLVAVGLGSIMYYLLSGSNKSMLMLIGVVALILADLIGGIEMYYFSHFMLIVLTRAFYILALVALYYYAISIEVPKFDSILIEEDERITSNDDGPTS
ncbi:hypothetical protein ACFQ1M_06625 [Sungkyunkwania multivorans]|uniref:YhhN-like protein n=1 Tax=Sungkyunkwania multivorans TaxID=1173618 RepID=A0ABW3CVV6_9FLAO